MYHIPRMTFETPSYNRAKTQPGGACIATQPVLKSELLLLLLLLSCRAVHVMRCVLASATHGQQWQGKHTDVACSLTCCTGWDLWLWKVERGQGAGAHCNACL